MTYKLSVHWEQVCPCQVAQYCHKCTIIFGWCRHCFETREYFADSKIGFCATFILKTSSSFTRLYQSTLYLRGTMPTLNFTRTSFFSLLTTAKWTNYAFDWNWMGIVVFGSTLYLVYFMVGFHIFFLTFVVFDVGICGAIVDTNNVEHHRN